MAERGRQRDRKTEKEHWMEQVLGRTAALTGSWGTCESVATRGRIMREATAVSLGCSTKEVGERRVGRARGEGRTFREEHW